MTEPLTAAQIIKMIHPDLPPATAHFLLNEAKPLLELIEAQAEELAKRESGEPLTPKGLTDAVMELAELLGNDPASAKLIDKCAWDHLLVYTHPQASEPVGINGLTEAETSASMSVRGLSAPIVGLQSVHDAITSDPSLCDPAPKRPPNCGTGHCSCIECVMEPAPSTAVEVSDLDARGMLASKLTCWHRLTEKESNELVALLQSTPDARPVGELTLAQITRIYDRYGGDMVNCTRAIERELAAARTQPERNRQ